MQMLNIHLFSVASPNQSIFLVGYEIAHVSLFVFLPRAQTKPLLIDKCSFESFSEDAFFFNREADLEEFS